MKRLLLFLILLLGHAARSKGQTFGPPQDGMRHAAETTSETNETHRCGGIQAATIRPSKHTAAATQLLPLQFIPSKHTAAVPAAATRPKTAYANRR